MMKCKIFEIRDRSTCLAVTAMQMHSTEEAEKYLLARAGFPSDGYATVVLTNLETFESTYDAYKWDNRSLREAHKYIQQNFNSLESGDVIDIEYILGETKEPKKSLRVS